MPVNHALNAYRGLSTSQAELRFIAVSTMLRPEVVEYPDSNKFSASTVLPGTGGGFRLLGGEVRFGRLLA